MDSFEKRIQFSKQLSALTPAKQASQDLCNFLIRNYVIQEDLYPSILETLPLVNLNSRLNILQFLDDLLSMIVNDSKYSSNDIIYNYALLIVTDLRKIIQLVLPETPKDLEDSSNKTSLPALAPSYSSNQFFEIRCLTNLPSTYIILSHISKLFKFSKLQEYQSKFHSNLLTVSDKHSIAHGNTFDDHAIYLTEAISNTTTADTDQLIPEKIKTGLESAWEFIIEKKRQSEYERLLIDTYENPFDNSKSDNAIQTESNSIESTDESENNNNNNNSNNNNSNNNSNINSISNPLLLTHNQIMQRIEADRERQKRGKETLWQVSRTEGSINVAEFEFIYDSLDLFDVVGDKGVIDEMDELYRSAIEVVEVKSTKNGQNHKNKNKNINHHISSSTSSYGYHHSYNNNKSQWRDRRDTYDYGVRRGASIPYNPQFKKRRYN